MLQAGWGRFISKGTVAFVGLGSIALPYSLSGPTQVPISADDPIFASATYLRNNPNRNPETKDLFVRTLKIDEIKPALLEKEGSLVEAFCAGVWGGSGPLLASSSFIS